MPGIILLGLGPGNPAHLTREAWDLLSSTKELWLRTLQHPVVNCLPSSVILHSFDDLYENGDDFDAVYAGIVEEVLNLGLRPEGVVYAVPGDPFIAEATSPEIARRARDVRPEPIPVRIINGISFLEPVFSALRLDPYPRLVLMDALELGEAHVPLFPPDLPVLIAQVYSRLVASEVKLTLNTIYPDTHPVCLVHAAGTDQECLEHIPLYEIDRSERIGLLTALYVPPLGEGTSFESFQEIVARLRAPDGCPWDREQTHSTLRTHLLEESYEALEAMDSGEPEKIAEEFGDLLLQIVLNAQIASEDGEFNAADIIKGIHDKIVRRHPHVFGDVELDDVDGVLKNWENLKARERANSREPEKGLLDGVPVSLPALSQAQEYQDRAVRVGFDWPDISGVLDKIIEEIEEVRQAKNNDELEAELGDLLFALVNLIRWKKVDAEMALRRANKRFRKRFSYIEQAARQQGKRLQDMTLEEMEGFWQEAKHIE